MWSQGMMAPPPPEYGPPRQRMPPPQIQWVRSDSGENIADARRQRKKQKRLATRNGRNNNRVNKILADERIVDDANERPPTPAPWCALPAFEAVGSRFDHLMLDAPQDQILRDAVQYVEEGATARNQAIDDQYGNQQIAEACGNEWHEEAEPSQLTEEEMAELMKVASLLKDSPGSDFHALAVDDLTVADWFQVATEAV
jgi:hypothetical protein